MLRSTATSVIDVTSESVNRTELLIRILRYFEDHLRELEARELDLADRWQRLCLLQGRTVCVKTGSEQVVGVCQGIDNEGALMLQTESGIQRCFTGTVAKIY